VLGVSEIVQVLDCAFPLLKEKHRENSENCKCREFQSLISHLLCVLISAPSHCCWMTFNGRQITVDELLGAGQIAHTM